MQSEGVGLLQWLPLYFLTKKQAETLMSNNENNHASLQDCSSVVFTRESAAVKWFVAQHYNHSNEFLAGALCCSSRAHLPPTQIHQSGVHHRAKQRSSRHSHYSLCHSASPRYNFFSFFFFLCRQKRLFVSSAVVWNEFTMFFLLSFLRFLL